MAPNILKMFLRGNYDVSHFKKPTALNSVLTDNVNGTHIFNYQNSNSESVIVYLIIFNLQIRKTRGRLYNVGHINVFLSKFSHVLGILVGYLVIPVGFRHLIRNHYTHSIYATESRHNMDIAVLTIQEKLQCVIWYIQRLSTATGGTFTHSVEKPACLHDNIQMS